MVLLTTGGRLCCFLPTSAFDVLSLLGHRIWMMFLRGCEIELVSNQIFTEKSKNHELELGDIGLNPPVSASDKPETIDDR